MTEQEIKQIESQGYQLSALMKESLRRCSSVTIVDDDDGKGANFIFVFNPPNKSD